jgi:phosphohistidine phosphatase
MDDWPDSRPITCAGFTPKPHASLAKAFMTRTLILIRHAKSDWDDPGLDDHDRRLNDRGRLSAPRIGAWLAEQGTTPDVVLCSTARRTRETWDGIATELTATPKPVYTRALYHAAPVDMLNAIRDSDAACLAVVAHNPGIGALAWSLCSTRPQHQKFGLYPTGATLILSFDVDHMSDIAPGQGQVAGFAIPRELPDPT